MDCVKNLKIYKQITIHIDLMLYQPVWDCLLKAPALSAPESNGEINGMRIMEWWVNWKYDCLDRNTRELQLARNKSASSDTEQRKASFCFPQVKEADCSELGLWCNKNQRFEF